MTSNSAAPPTDASADASDGVPKEGEILGGKYRVERVLGEGGMGVVVAAQHTTLRQKVAIKVLLPEAAKRADSTERFLREARAAVSIQSEHVARVMDVGQFDTGQPYIVMEFLTGDDLDALLEKRTNLPIEEAIDYILQACEAIAEAHSLGIIHRDLKPANIFVTQRAGGSPLVKVLDFGLSKVTRPDALDQSSAALTAANVVMGSPCYMSPEQIKSLKGLDARTDIWALGVILYQMITGARPFDAPSLGALFVVIGTDPPPPMKNLRPDIPPALEAVIFRCLEKDKAKRIQTIAELARELAPFAAERSKVSIERVHRVLGDATPVTMGPQAAPNPGPAGRAPIPGRRSSLPNDVADLKLSDDDDGDNAPTLMRDPTVHPSVPPPAPAGGATQPIPASASNPPPPPAAVIGAAPPTKSGSMIAIPGDRSAPSLPPARSASRGGLVGAIVALAVIAVAAVAFIAMRSTSSEEPHHTPAAAKDAGAAKPATP
jgi:serine/threonine-protein kinase